MGENNSARPLIRRAVPADGRAVQSFVFATLLSYGITPDPDGLDADIVAFGTAGDGSVCEFVAELDGCVVGSVVIGPWSQSQTGDEAWLSKLFVDQEYRGRGMGRALHDRAIAEARAQGYRRISLATRTIFREAVVLYEASGWVRGPDLPPDYGPDRTYFYDLGEPGQRPEADKLRGE